MTRSLDHHIQRDIIVRLSMAPELRFSDLKPDNIENNHFTYHLNLLIKDGLLAKDGSEYTLTPLGLNYVDHLSYKNRRPRNQPKIVCLLIIKDREGQYLLARRKVQPFYGLSGLVSGKQHLGEDLFEHAQRELKEKTGLTINLVKRGYVGVKISKDGQVVSQIAAHVFSGVTEPFNLHQNDDRFELYWAGPKDISKAELVPGTAEIIELAESGNQLFFESLTFDV